MTTAEVWTIVLAGAGIAVGLVTTALIRLVDTPTAAGHGGVSRLRARAARAVEG